MMKTCGRCNVEKAESEFGVNNAKDDGLQGYCRDCMREYTATKRKLKRVDKVNKTADIVAYRKEYRKNNRDKVVALQTAWRKSHPEWCREKDRKKYERKMKANRGPDYVVGDPANMLFKTKPVMRIVGWRTDEEKAQSKRAKRRVQTALKNGTLVKLPCWTCGCLDVEGHHPDYDAPLDVVWLCKTHHLQVHKEHRPNEYVRVDK